MNAIAEGNYTAKLDLKPERLEGLSEKLIEQHWKLYEGYVDNVNLLRSALEDGLRGGKALSDQFLSEIERRLGFEYNGMVLHEYYFGALAPGLAEPGKSSKLALRFAKDFGTYENWKKRFSDIGKMRGVGWVMAAIDPSFGKLVNFWVSDHEVGHVAGFIPIIAMDMWEHAYILDYGAKADGRAAYIEAYFKNLDWRTIEDRWALADQGKIRPRAAVASLA